MRILPVIDLKEGLVVRGVGGRRSAYRPIVSQLCTDPRLHSVAHAFARLGFRQAYLADLDAIERMVPGTVLTELDDGSGFPLEFIVDAGLRDAGSARTLARATFGDKPLAGIVAGLETLEGPSELEAILKEVGPERLIFSLDMRSGRPLTAQRAWQGLSPIEIACIALRTGVQRFILLDLARVGMASGVGTEPLCRDLRGLAPAVEIIAGGGVRSADDLDSLARAGCDAALVASALHDGRLDAAQCAARC